MIVSRLRLQNFRNYELAEAELSPGLNVFYGDNAQGKTNLLEAVDYMSSGRSFRALRERELIRFGCREAAICAQVEHEDRRYTLKASLSLEKRRRIEINDLKKPSAAALSQVLDTVVFLPEDLCLVREGAAARRRFLDQSLCKLRPRYQKALQEYTRACEQKTKLLKSLDGKPSMLDAMDVFSMSMAQAGAAIIRYRALYLKKLTPAAQAVNLDISGGRDALTLAYRTVSAIEDPEAPEQVLCKTLYDHILSLRSAEIAARACLSGPHKDDVEISINESPARAFGSQGQTRSAALSLKLAERQIHFEDSGSWPVLLLDDVLSELDGMRRDFVLSRISGGQVLVTCCEPGLIASAGRVLRVEGGHIA